MDVVRLSITGGLALVGALTLAAATHRGRAEPLPGPVSSASFAELPSAAPNAPVLVTPSTPTLAMVRPGRDNPFDVLAPFPGASESARPSPLGEHATSGLGAWDAYIEEASQRFGVPSSWVRSVMRAESGGLQFLNGRPITSSKGAAGLMQVMPSTYADLRMRYGLGPNPYDPHDNVLAGTAYLREMYDRFGAPAFLAAYNAGPGRVGAFLARGRALPFETRQYLSNVAPSVVGHVEPRAAKPRAITSPTSSPVQDLTSSGLLARRGSAATVLPRSPEPAPLFVTAVRAGSTSPSQAEAPSGDGLFVVLSNADRRRKSSADTSSEN